jgi:hemolysin activation/secretion protein
MTKRCLNKIKSNFKTLILTAVLLPIFSPQVFAQTTQDAINQQDWITRQQQNILEDKKREREFDTISKEHERKEKEEEEESKKSQPMVSGKMPGCVVIKEIHLLDAKSLSNYRQKKIVAPFIGKCMEGTTLASVIKAVNDYYQSKGYVTTQVKVPKQNLRSSAHQLILEF